jgi:iron complex outermembrane recepter protein
MPFHNTALFAYGSYRLTDDITASVQLNYGENQAESQAGGRNGNVVIHDDNPFIPAAVKSMMTANGITTFTMGVNNSNNINPSDYTVQNWGLAVGQDYIWNKRQLTRGVFSLDGAFTLFGNDWSWKASAVHSQVRERQFAPYNTLNQNYANAIDPITVTATGKDSLGGGNSALAAQVRAALTASGVHVPQAGEIACRSSLTATSWGTVTDPKTGLTSVVPGGLTPNCVPLDQFGEGVASQAAINYLAPGRVDPSVEDQATYIMQQSVFAVSMQGELPWGLPAGKIAVATGYEYRIEQQTNLMDPLMLGSTSSWESANYTQFAGHYYTNEGFLEINAPLLRDSIVGSLDFNAAGRMTDYSTSGLVKTWKLGLTSQVNQDIRLRTTLSSDIRAPTIAELFAPASFGIGQTKYPPVTGPSFRVVSARSGNPGLDPEQATTISGGIVLTPHWIENLSLSFDWYSISLHKAIFTDPNAVQECYNGLTVYCTNVFFGKGWPGSTAVPVAQEIDGNGKPASGYPTTLGTFPADCEGCLNLTLTSPLNADSETVSGLDFQVDYHMDLFAGVLSWHLVGNYTDEQTITELGVKFDGAGTLSPIGVSDPLVSRSSPKFRSTLAATYEEGPYSFTVQTRLIGSAVYSHTFVEGTDIDNNGIPAVAYLDLRAAYNWSDALQLYFAVDNTFNTPPPLTDVGSYSSGQIYDQLGRAIRVGVRFNY